MVKGVDIQKSLPSPSLLFCGPAFCPTPSLQYSKILQLMITLAKMYSSFASPANSLLFGSTVSSSVSSFWLCEELVINAYLKICGLLAPTLWYSSSDIGVTQVFWGARPTVSSSCSEKGLFISSWSDCSSCMPTSLLLFPANRDPSSLCGLLTPKALLHAFFLSNRKDTLTHLLSFLESLHPCLVILLYELLKHL